MKRQYRFDIDLESCRIGTEHDFFLFVVHWFGKYNAKYDRLGSAEWGPDCDCQQAPTVFCCWGWNGRSGLLGKGVHITSIAVLIHGIFYVMSVLLGSLVNTYIGQHAGLTMSLSMYSNVLPFCNAAKV